MNYKITHTTKYTYSDAVPVCHNLVHLVPRRLRHQARHQSRLLVHPEPADISHRTDYFGNPVSYFSIEQAHRGMTVTSVSEVTVTPVARPASSETPAWEGVARQLFLDRSEEVLDACQFVTASPSVRSLDAMLEYAAPSFLTGRPILEAVVDLTSRIHREFTYDPRATTVHTPIDQVLKARRGVCQDFAHLQIGCLRSLGLAARYVSGYLRTNPPPGRPRLIGADASHAWLSVYCGDAGWIDVDPTNDVVLSADHVTVAWGRDYNDVCPIQGVIVGGGDHRMHVSVDVAPEGREAE